MAEFNFRKKTHQTPKTTKTSGASTQSTNGPSNALSRSAFKRKLARKAAFDDREEEEAESLTYHVPLVKRRKKRKDEENSPSLANPPTPEPDDKELPTPRKLNFEAGSPRGSLAPSPSDLPAKRKRGRPAGRKMQTVVTEAPKEEQKKEGVRPVAPTEEEQDLSGPEQSPKRQRVDDDSSEVAPPSPSSPAKKAEKVKEKAQEKAQEKASTQRQTRSGSAQSRAAKPGGLSAQQKHLKAKLDDEMKRIVNRFQGTRSSYLIQFMEQVCTKFVAEQLPAIPEEELAAPVPAPTKKAGKAKQPKALTVPNPGNLDLEKKERDLKALVDRLTAEAKEWSDLKQQYTTVPPKRKLRVPFVDATPQKEVAPKVIPNKSLEILSLQVDELKPILKDIKHFNATSEKFCSDMATSLAGKELEASTKADPKELIRSLAYAEDL